MQLALDSRLYRHISREITKGNILLHFDSGHLLAGPT